MGPFPTGESLLVLVDYYSKFYEVVIMRSTTAKRVVDALTQIFSGSRYGFPFRLKSDSGPQFLSDHGIEHVTSPPLWPPANAGQWTEPNSA